MYVYAENPRATMKMTKNFFSQIQLKTFSAGWEEHIAAQRVNQIKAEKEIATKLQPEFWVIKLYLFQTQMTEGTWPNIKNDPLSTIIIAAEPVVSNSNLDVLLNLSSILILFF